MRIRPILISVSTFSFLSFLRRAIFYAFFYVYLRNFLGLSNTLSALLGTANLATSIVGQLRLWGPRLNRDPSLARLYVIRGEMIAGVVYLIAFIGHRIFIDLNSNIGAAFFLISCTSFLEIFWSGSDLGIRHLIAKATGGQNRGRLVGSIDGMGLLGQLIGFLVGGYFYADGWGFFNGTMFYMVVILIFSCAIVIFLSPEEKFPYEQDTKAIITADGLQEVFKVPYFGLFILTLGILTIGISSSSQIFYYYVTLNFNEQILSYLLILFTISGALLSPIGGKISDLIGRIPILFVSALGASVSYFLFFFLPDQALIVIALVYILQGASVALIQSVSFAYSADVLQKSLQGTGFAVYNLTLATGWGLAGFLVGGPVADILIYLGESNDVAYRGSFFVSSIILFIGAIVLVILEIKQRRQNIKFTGEFVRMGSS